MEAATLHCSEVSLHFLHCSGEIFGCSWPKVKDVSFQVSAPALEAGLRFGIRAWLFLVILTSVIIGIGVLPLVPASRFLWFITLT